MKSFLPIASAVALAAGLFASAPASAVNFTIFDVEINKGEQATGTINPANGFPGGISGSFGFGQMVLTTSIGEIDAWCIDFFHDIVIGPNHNYSYTTSPFVSAVTDGNTNPPIVLLTDPQKQTIANLIAQGNFLLQGGGGTTQESLGTQLAIWSVEYGAPFTFSTADPLMVAEVASLIATSSNFAGNADALISLQGLQGLAAGDGGFITGNIPELPEPASLALLGFGLVGLGALRRKRA